MTRRQLGRVASQQTFTALRKPLCRGKSGPVQVMFVPVEIHGGPQVQVAFAVSKQCGGAVQRNRIRRRLREAVLGLSRGLPPGAYLVRTSPEAKEASYAELAQSLKECLVKVEKLSKEKSA